MSGNVNLIVNATGAVAALIVVGWFGMSWLDKDEPAICEGRYPVSTRFNLTSASGELVSLSELQARLGSSEWGVLENATILPPETDQDHPLLAVALRKDAGADADQTPAGLGFTWMPAELLDARPNAACLSYSIYFPPELSFGNGGTLPGLAIGSTFDPRGDAVVGQGAAVRLGWNKDGAPVVNVQDATAEGWKILPTVAGKASLRRGRWVTIEQEVILNDAGKKNGVARIWIDGQFAGENKQLELRTDAAPAIAGVRTDIHYGGALKPSGAPADTEIRLTPFVLRWQ